MLININPAKEWKNFIELYNSYENRENVCLLFSDGIILHNDLKYNHFEPFPINRMFQE